MMTSSNGNIFRITGPCVGNSPVTGEFPSQRPVTRNFDVFVDLCLNKWLSKQSWGLWFETPSRSLWRHCNVFVFSRLQIRLWRWSAISHPLQRKQCYKWDYQWQRTSGLWHEQWRQIQVNLFSNFAKNSSSQAFKKTFPKLPLAKSQPVFTPQTNPRFIKLHVDINIFILSNFGW